MMPGWGAFGMGGGMPRTFEEQYHCYSVAYADKAHLEVSTVPCLVQMKPGIVEKGV